MPGPIVHLVVQQRLSRYLMRTEKDLAALLNTAPASPYSAFGSIGPDFLFFSLKEYGTPLDELTNFVFGVYDALEPFIQFYETTIAPVKDAIDDAVAAIDEAAFQGLFGQIQNTASLMTTTALTAAAKVATGNVDLFYGFRPKVQAGEKMNAWYWFDLLHYHRTGQFCSTMWQLATESGDPDLQRYCLGYASHIGTDVVGHPFVNAIVGGPFRTHWHRHKLVENWIDAYARRRYPDSGAVMSALNLGPDDTYLSDAISGSYYAHLCAFADGKMPDKLQDLLSKAMNQTYGHLGHLSPLGGADLDAAYRLWLTWFDRSTAIGSAQKPTPVAPPGSATASLVNDFVNSFPAPPSAAPSGGGFSVSAIFAAIFAFLKWLGEVILYVTTWIITHTHEIVTLPYVEATKLVKWLLYQIEKGIWEFYDNLRFMLVLGGYLFPEPRDLDKSPWGNAFTNTAFAHTTGGGFANFGSYPHVEESHVLTGTTSHHLIYPLTMQELPHTEPAPKPFHGAFPEVFISTGWNFDPAIEALYDCQAPYGADNQYTHHVDSASWNTGQFGCALDFCARLIGRGMERLPNFNLDGDRGYGWKTWKADVEGADLGTVNPLQVNYKDA